ncbi:Nucleic acid-binding OB-fold [Penicillium canariense]|uniref:Nucleic acid-binding OB-fold n=1 Tax=Penicillium canariense TaxID=189055 RepID=A0A9W9HX95_9EURO|nr:Nucleic acid-binding OB-fold [Penicillium canariense]KAJ5159405.1 Nucleic acid-binding OB-fold [Penicillium canariense]
MFRSQVFPSAKRLQCKARAGVWNDYSGELEDLVQNLLDTHQDQPTEVRRRDQVKIITTPWTNTQTPKHACQSRRESKWLHFRASRT